MKNITIQKQANKRVPRKTVYSNKSKGPKTLEAKKSTKKCKKSKSPQKKCRR